MYEPEFSAQIAFTRADLENRPAAATNWVNVMCREAAARGMMHVRVNRMDNGGTMVYVFEGWPERPPADQMPEPCFHMTRPENVPSSAG